MKKSAFVLAMMLVLSVFAFVGCGNNDKDMTDNGTVTEHNGGSVVDETEKGVDDLGDAARDGVDDLADGAKDLVDGDDSSTVKNDTDNTKSETKNMN